MSADERPQEDPFEGGVLPVRLDFEIPVAHLLTQTDMPTVVSFVHEFTASVMNHGRQIVGELQALLEKYGLKADMPDFEYSKSESVTDGAPGERVEADATSPEG